MRADKANIKMLWLKPDCESKQVCKIMLQHHQLQYKYLLPSTLCLRCSDVKTLPAHPCIQQLALVWTLFSTLYALSNTLTFRTLYTPLSLSLHPKYSPPYTSTFYFLYPTSTVSTLYILYYPYKPNTLSFHILHLTINTTTYAYLKLLNMQVQKCQVIPDRDKWLRTTAPHRSTQTSI